MSNLHQCNRCGLRSYECGHYDHGNNDLCQHFILPLDNSRMFAHWYSFTGRIGRMEYMLTLLIALVLYFLVLFIAGQVMELNGWALENTLHLYLFTFICMIPSAYLAIAAGVKRAHDSGCSPWYALTPLIPVLFLNVITFVLFCAGCIFLFKDKGQEGVNEYGSNPNESYNQQVSLDDIPRY